MLLVAPVVTVVIDIRIATDKGKMRQAVAGTEMEILILMMIADEMSAAAKVTKAMASAVASMTLMALVAAEMLEPATLECKMDAATG